MMIPSMDIKRQYNKYKDELDETVLRVLHSGQFILGPVVEQFEYSFAEYCKTKYAVGVGNGTDALVIALRACGIRPGDEVITTAMSFFATAESIVAVGAVPVFVDCTKDTFLMDVSKIEEAITPKTKAIIPVHLYGQCCDMDIIMEIARHFNLVVIEDAAQAAGAEYKGKKAGSIGDAGCISFFPTKNLGCCGDGGVIVTNNESINRQCRALRVHGSGNDGVYTYGKQTGSDVSKVEIDFQGNLPKYYNFVIGYNSRLDALQAAILSKKLLYLDQWNARRREIADQYERKITNAMVIKPNVKSYNIPIYYVYVLATKNRNGLRNYLDNKGINSGIYFPVPLHLQKVFEALDYKKGDMPNAEYVSEHTLTIPMFPELTQNEIDTVIDAINQWANE